MLNEHKMIVIAWAERLDNASDFARRVGAPFYPIYARGLDSSRLLVPLRYLNQTWRTWKLFLKEKPAVVHVTNPPILAALNVFLYCKLFGAQYILCTHPPALYSKKWAWTVPLLRFLARKALINTLDQERFRVMFESWGAPSLVLTKMPRAYTPAPFERSQDGRYPITVVNTFAPDEPILPILEAGRAMPDVHFYVLGNTALADPEVLASAPENVTFTGWLSHDEYWDQLKRSRAVMTLTTYPHSLVAGGTDGMSVGRPLLLSKQPALTDHFTKGTVFVENTGASITEGVRLLQEKEALLRQEVLEMAVEKRQIWETNYQELLNKIGDSQTGAFLVKA